MEAARVHRTERRRLNREKTQGGGQGSCLNIQHSTCLNLGREPPERIRDNSVWCSHRARDSACFHQRNWETSLFTECEIEFSQKACLGHREQLALDEMQLWSHLTNMKNKNLKDPTVFQLYNYIPEQNSRTFIEIQKYSAPSKG